MHPINTPLTISLTEDSEIEISGSFPGVDSWPSVYKKDLIGIPRGPGCYALYRDGILIYIGESECLAERIPGHNVAYDEARWLRLDGAQRFVAEKMLIWHYMPQDNKELKRHDWRMRIKEEALNA